MLFNSYEFLFLLLPIALIGDNLLRSKATARTVWLLVCSLVFYARWNPSYIFLLVGSITVNYTIGTTLIRSPSRMLLAVGVSLNLLAIGYFKYGMFTAQNLEVLLGRPFHVGQIILPLAISFFTFQQIAYLADCYAGDISENYSPLQYALFVTFFPQLIAGPIVHHAQLAPQLNSDRQSSYANLAIGFTIFSIGLFKKTILGDGIAPYANDLFDDPRAWTNPSMVHAWIGVLAYGFQIYFDFSGYSDMAIGAARMFGIKLPLNFFAPYRATSISDFWRRWHMTLSAFLRDYLYIPLGGNRRGSFARYRNLLITMLLGGLWHGAGWTFITWGLLHGCYLVLQHGWSKFVRVPKLVKDSALYRFLCFLVTFLAVQIAWTFFRAGTFEAAVKIIRGLFGFNGISLPRSIVNQIGGIGALVEQLGISTDSSSGTAFVESMCAFAVLAILVWVCPTTQELLRRFQPAWDFVDKESGLSTDGFGWKLKFQWGPNLRWGLMVSAMLVAGILTLPQVSEFLYFQF